MRVVIHAPTRPPPQRRRHDRRRASSRARSVAHDHGGALQALVDSGEARREFRKLAVTHADGKRYLLVGLGARDAFDPERARVAAATVVGRARELGRQGAVLGGARTTSATPHAGALVEGTLLAGYRYRALQERRTTEGLEALVLSAHDDVSARGRVRRRRQPRPPTARATCRTRRPTT